MLQKIVVTANIARKTSSSCPLDAEEDRSRLTSNQFKWISCRADYRNDSFSSAWASEIGTTYHHCQDLFRSLTAQTLPPLPVSTKVFSTFSFWRNVRAGSPSRGRAVVVLCQRLQPAELAHSFLCCSCVCICFYGPFNCISFHIVSRQLSAFFPLFFRP